MRKLFLLVSLVFSIQLNSVCQSLPDSTATWTIASIGWGSYFANETFVITGDTTINSTIYKAIYTTKDSIYNPAISSYFCAVRELNDKWFFIPADSTKEFMLYDFDIKIGDAVKINNPWTEGEMELIVFKADSIELNGVYYKKFELGFMLPQQQHRVIDHWIKGIGSTQGIYQSGFRLVDAGYQLLCFHRNDTLVYLDSPDNTCGFLSTGIRTKSSVPEIKLSPNPVFDQLSVISHHSFIIEIYDSAGKKVISSDSKQIDVSFLLKGVYIVKIYDTKRGFIKSEKLIKQ